MLILRPDWRERRIGARLHGVVALRERADKADIVTVLRMHAGDEGDLVVLKAVRRGDFLIGIRDLRAPGDDPPGVIALENVAGRRARRGKRQSAYRSHDPESHRPFPLDSGHLSISLVRP